MRRNFEPIGKAMRRNYVSLTLSFSLSSPLSLSRDRCLSRCSSPFITLNGLSEWFFVCIYVCQFIKNAGKLPALCFYVFDQNGFTRHTYSKHAS